MSVTFKRIQENPPSSPTDIYVVPGSGVQAAIIGQLTVINMDFSSSTFRMRIIKSGDSATLDNVIESEIPIDQNGTVSVPSFLGHALFPGDSINIEPDNDEFNVQLTIKEFTF